MAGRNRQRGIFGLAPLISLAIYAGIAAVALGAIYAFDQSRQNIGERKARAELAPITGVCDDFGHKLKPSDCAAHIRVAVKDRDTAIAANVALKADLGRLAIERQACNDEVDKLERRSAAAAAAAAARKPADDARIAAITPEREELIRVWGLPEPGGSCEARLAARDAMWKKVAEQRARDFPGQVGPPATAGGGLRLAEPPPASPTSAPTVRPLPVNPLRPK